MSIEGKYSVLDVARHVVNYCNSKSIYIDNLKLQKLLYFVQASFLYSFKGKLGCFQEDIVAWQYGPVVVEAYQEFKVFGSSMIPEIESFTVFDKANWAFTRELFEDKIVHNRKDSEIINSTIEHFRDYSGTQLIDLTHCQAPWKQAYEKGANSVIEKESIYNFFK